MREIEYQVVRSDNWNWSRTWKVIEEVWKSFADELESRTELFEGSLADCAVFLSLRKDGYIK